MEEENISPSLSDQYGSQHLRRTRSAVLQTGLLWLFAVKFTQSDVWEILLFAEVLMNLLPSAQEDSCSVTPSLSKSVQVSNGLLIKIQTPAFDQRAKQELLKLTPINDFIYWISDSMAMQNFFPLNY